MDIYFCFIDFITIIIIIIWLHQYSFTLLLSFPLGNPMDLGDADSS